MRKGLSRPPLERMLRIHNLIVAGKSPLPNMRNLAELLDVNRKTVQRDIEFMRDRLDLPLQYDSSHWGFRYAQPAKFPFPTQETLTT